MTHLHEWIAQLELHKSHYTRGHAPMRQYLDRGVSVADLFGAYTETCEVLNRDKVPEDKQDHVSLPVFRDVFKYKYNIGPRQVVCFCFFVIFFKY